MIRSPWDGASRRPLRVLLALVAAVDLLALTAAVIMNPAGPISHPLAPGFLLGLGGHPERVIPIAAIGLFALLRFARAAGSLAPGLVGLGALMLLCEAHAALIEGPMRIFFATGATLSGWLAGLGYARLLGHARDDEEAERLAEMGAVAGLCATYLGAATSKLLAGGLSWADANTLRSIVFSQRGIPGGSPFDFYAWSIAAHPSLAWALASLTLFIQLSALVYPFSRIARAVSGTLLLCFHLNVFFLTPILFPQSMILLAAFSYPWPRWIARLRGKAPPPAETSADPAAPAPSAARVRQATWRAAAILVAMAGVVAVLPVRAYTMLHHRRSALHALEKRPPAEPAPPPVAPEVRAFLDQLKDGDDLGGFRVEAIVGPHDGAVDVRVARGARRFEISVVRKGSRPMAAPASTDRYDLFYGRLTPPGEPLTPEDRDRVLAALAARLQRAAAEAPPGL